MVTYGGNRPTVNDNEILTAQAFNDATRFWVTDELPDTGKDGDVVFVVGDPVAGGGKVLQVVRATNTTQFATTSTSYVDATGMSVSITPTSSESNIYVFCTFVHSQSSGAGNTRAYFKMLNADDVAVSGAQQVESGISVNTFWGNPVTLIGFASPASTTEQTYRMQVRSANSGSTAQMQNQNATGQMIAIEVGA